MTTAESDRETGERGENGDNSDVGTGETAYPADAVESAAVATASEESLGWRGWVVVAWLVVSLVAIPWAIVFLPEVQGFLASLGLGLRDAYLVLPMLPALGLGALGVWAAVANRRGE